MHKQNKSIEEQTNTRNPLNNKLLHVQTQIARRKIVKKGQHKTLNIKAWGMTKARMKHMRLLKTSNRPLKTKPTKTEPIKHVRKETRETNTTTKTHTKHTQNLHKTRTPLHPSVLQTTLILAALLCGRRMCRRGRSNGAHGATWDAGLGVLRWASLGVFFFYF